MTSRVPPRTKKILMDTAVSSLSKLYGINTSLDLINQTDLRDTRYSSTLPGTSQTAPTQNVNTNGIRTTTSTEDDAERAIMRALLDDSAGANTIKQTIRSIQGTQLNPENLNHAVDIYYNGSENANLVQSVTIKDILGLRQDTFINTESSPTKTNPSLSALLVNTGRISFTQRNNNIVTLFANAIPNLEINKIQPYLDIKFNTPRSPIITENNANILNGMSLVKFLNGASAVKPKSVLETLALANKSTRPRTGTGSSASTQVPSDDYTLAGMELFTTPQSLVNGNYKDNPIYHSQKIFDIYQPFMSIMGVDLQVVATRGLMSNKTGTIKLKLHDRTRLADVAEFIRPEYYGANELIIEYGWYHNEGDSLTSQSTSRNPYGDLLNGMRMEEKYQILNSSFSMTENGEVDIELRISMKGANDFETESILTTEDTIANPLRNIQTLQSTITGLRRAVFGENNSNYGGREIRGTQILDAAGDGVNHLFLTKEIRDSLTQMQTFLNRSRNSSGSRANNIDELRAALTNYQTEVQNVQKTLASLMQEKLRSMATGPDPIKDGALIKLGLNGANRDGQLTSTIDDRVTITGGAENVRAFNEFLTSIGLGSTGNNSSSQYRVNGCFSLAKLLLTFVGIPLAQTKKYDDIQFYFYPFNINAAGANRINTGEFLINADLFMLKFMQWRLGNLGQTSNVNIREFIQWLASTFFDDPVSDVYGLRSGERNMPLYRRIFADGNIGVEPNIPSGRRNEAAQDTFMQNLNETLTRLTPNGEFRVPQIEFYMESFPAKATEDTGYPNEQMSILKIHVFDRLNSPYESLQQINKSSRDTNIASIGRAITDTQSAINQPLPSGNQNTNAARTSEQTRNDTIIRSARDYNRAIQDAVANGIIEQIPNTNPARYRLSGGPNSARKLKDFFYSVAPYIIFGNAASTIKNANLQSLQDSRLTTVNFLRSHTASQLQPNGENPGGLPMQIIPAQLELEMLGCPYFNVGQTLFIDFNTGTTVDNFYSVVGVTHNIAPGTFDTRVKLAPTDGYGQYINILNTINNFVEDLDDTSGEDARTIQGEELARSNI